LTVAMMVVMLVQIQVGLVAGQHLPPPIDNIPIAADAVIYLDGM
jgi:hypothetical protein